MMLSNRVSYLTLGTVLGNNVTMPVLINGLLSCLELFYLIAWGRTCYLVYVLCFI